MLRSGRANAPALILRCKNLEAFCDEPGKAGNQDYLLEDMGLYYESLSANFIAMLRQLSEQQEQELLQLRKTLDLNLWSRYCK
jgi:hypothetical protein